MISGATARKYVRKGSFGILFFATVSISVYIGDAYRPITKAKICTEQVKQVSTMEELLLNINGQHAVRKGEGLWSIARKYKIPPKQLLAMNNMNRSTKLYPGQMINVPKK